MAYKYSFSDNEIYSSSDVNEITKRLVTSGIEDSFTDGVAYNVSKFNEMGKQLYTSGVVPEDCMTLKVNKIADDEILINPGLAFFSDGATIEIEAGGETLKITPGVKNYVYLKNDLADRNICYPCCSTEAPEGDYVALAEIDESGTVSDKRVYAKGKLPGYQSVAGAPLYINEIVEIELSDKYVASTSASFDIGYNDFNYILCCDFAESGGGCNVLSIYRISDGKIMSFYRQKKSDVDSYISDSKICLFHNGRRTDSATITLSDGVLKLKINSFSSSGLLGDVGDIMTIPVNLILF